MENDIVIVIIFAYKITIKYYSCIILHKFNVFYNFILFNSNLIPINQKT